METKELNKWQVKKGVFDGEPTIELWLNGGYVATLGKQAETISLHATEYPKQTRKYFLLSVSGGKKVV